MSKLKHLYLYLKRGGFHKEASALYSISSDIGDNIFNMPDFDFYNRIYVIRDLGDNQKNPDLWHKRFLDINSDIFLKDMPLKKISSGFHGEAWLTESGNVFKIFRNIGALKFYEEESELSAGGSKDALKIYDYGVFRLPENTNLFNFKNNILGWAIMEKLKTINELEEESGTVKKIGMFSDKLEELVNHIAYILGHSGTTGEFGIPEELKNNSPSDKADYIISHILPGSKYAVKLMDDMEMSGVLFSIENLKDIIESGIKQIELGRRDLGGYNFGYRDGKVVWFDPYSPVPSDIDPYEKKNSDEIYWDNNIGIDSQYKFREGLKVHVVSGPYEGMKGIISSTENNEITVLMNIIGRDTKANFKENELRIVE